ncbi:hypothetical protein PMIN06_011059 [Paraphaeosphaeria minitans]|uniref:Zinc-responsive transcriptional regulator ZAP1 n=1 Tax=Paraphaeosphaeria minitans TaxID=565426 RepID=A0A9P6KV93_9PLEO|nr:Zinc-responsive transcriptional regulator ZAP1 [Paraphaeosphaeria minitans]
MAHTYQGNDCDSAYGDDETLFAPDPMFALPAPLAGSKRDVDNAIRSDPKSTGLGLAVETGAWPEHGDPSAQRIRDPKLSCPSCESGRPSKRKASAVRVGEYHNVAARQSVSNSDQQFPDLCFEDFCQGCDLDAASCNSPCPSPCALPCPGDEQCSEEDACFDPHCEEGACSDHCADPECTKVAGIDEPCFCQKCDAQPCPLGDPRSECHLVHTAPTPAGTIYCYDDSRCHFQEGHHGYDPQLSGFESYPCYSHPHDTLNHCHGAVPTTSAVTTPVLSPGALTSIESAISSHPSPTPNHLVGTSCYLNIPGEHCHLDNPCCHGESRVCGDCIKAPQEHLDLWNASLAEGNGLANNFMTFGLQSSQPGAPSYSLAPSAMSMNIFDNSLNNPMYGFNDTTWLLPQSHYWDAFQNAAPQNLKVDFGTSAARLETKPEIQPASITGLDYSPTGGATDASQSCVCRWQHAPGLFCLATFPDPSALHAHIKVSHVDNCAQCVCQWENCEAASKDFKQRSKLSRHLLAHAGHRPYACSFKDCNKTFATNQAKDNHERTHTGERPYVCDRCGYTTTTHTQLQTHISALHEGKKPHKCRFCDFSCADSSNLSKHERTHQTLRPYRCPQPGCTFKPDCRWENLKRHIRRSGHCPQLLVEGSDEAKTYRENIKRETEEWNKRAGESEIVKMGRRKGRSK